MFIIDLNKFKLMINYFMQLVTTYNMNKDNNAICLFIFIKISIWYIGHWLLVTGYCTPQIMKSILYH